MRVPEWSSSVNAFNSMKILFHAEHLRKIAQGEFPPPITCDTDGSNACNQRCFYCNSQAYRKKSNSLMPKGHLLKLADFYASWGIKSTCIGGGGESLMNPEIKEFIPRVRKNGLEVGLITNGTLLDEDYATIVPQNCRFLGVSCDAATPETYRAMRGVDDFFRVRKNLERVCKEKSNTNPKLDINIKFLIHPINYKEIEMATKMAKELGCSGIHIRPIAIEGIWEVDNNNGCFNMENIIPEINEQLLKARELEDNNFKVFTVQHKFGSKFERVIKFNKCIATPINLTFGADGWTYVCFNVRGRETMRLASHYPDPNKILKIWGTKAHKDLLASIDPKNCPRCTYSTYHQVIEQAIAEDQMFHLFP